MSGVWLQIDSSISSTQKEMALLEVRNVVGKT
jgi:hypothetical protein